MSDVNACLEIIDIDISLLGKLIHMHKNQHRRAIYFKLLTQTHKNLRELKKCSKTTAFHLLSKDAKREKKEITAFETFQESIVRTTELCYKASSIFNALLGQTYFMPLALTSMAILARLVVALKELLMQLESQNRLPISDALQLRMSKAYITHNVQQLHRVTSLNVVDKSVSDGRLVVDVDDEKEDSLSMLPKHSPPVSSTGSIGIAFQTTVEKHPLSKLKKPNGKATKDAGPTFTMSYKSKAFVSSPSSGSNAAATDSLASRKERLAETSRLGVTESVVTLPTAPIGFTADSVEPVAAPVQSMIRVKQQAKKKLKRHVESPTEDSVLGKTSKKPKLLQPKTKVTKSKVDDIFSKLF